MDHAWRLVACNPEGAASEVINKKSIKRKLAVGFPV